jgi:hypothetical protein
MRGYGAAAVVALVAFTAAGCNGGASATESQLAVCDAGREFAADVATDAYSWQASQDAIARAAYDPGTDSVATAGAELVRVRQDPTGAWFEPFLRFAQACQDVDSPLHSDPRGLLCDLQTKRHAERPNIVSIDDDYCA